MHRICTNCQTIHNVAMSEYQGENHGMGRKYDPEALAEAAQETSMEVSNFSPDGKALRELHSDRAMTEGTDEDEMRLQAARRRVEDVRGWPIYEQVAQFEAETQEQQTRRRADAYGLIHDMEQDSGVEKELAAREHLSRGDEGASEVMALAAWPHLRKAMRAFENGRDGRAAKQGEKATEAMRKAEDRFDSDSSMPKPRAWWKFGRRK